MHIKTGLCKRRARFLYGSSLFFCKLDDLSGAGLDAVAAVDALFHVDNGEEIVDLDSVCGTLALTLAAANAAEVTHFDNGRALILVAAGNDSALALQ